MTHKKENPGRKKAEITPIIDGDARPDQPEEKKTDRTKPAVVKKKFTSNREADVNSLENFKDEK